MDQATLVGAGQTIVKALDESGARPRAAMWVQNAESDVWKLWLVPSSAGTDQHAFYRTIAEIVARHRNELGIIDTADTALVSEEHPAINGMRSMVTMPDLGIARFTNTLIGDFFLPDGIVLRMDL